MLYYVTGRKSTCGMTQQLPYISRSLPDAEGLTAYEVMPDRQTLIGPHGVVDLSGDTALRLHRAIQVLRELECGLPPIELEREPLKVSLGGLQWKTSE